VHDILELAMACHGSLLFRWNGLKAWPLHQG
jgi:hypothetical protein